MSTQEMDKNKHLDKRKRKKFQEKNLGKFYSHKKLLSKQLISKNVH